MPPAFAGSAEEHTGRLGGRAAPGPALPEGPRYPRFVQAMLWLKQPTWLLEHCTRIYGDVFTVRLPLGVNLTQRREDLYENPAAFWPERFAGQAAPSFGWFPFGGGIRRCIGASFATFEMGIVIPEVLRAVTLRPASRRPARIRREAVTFVPRGGARCVVTARTPRLSAPGERSGSDAGPGPRRRR
jgi:hypothetical protein